MTLLTRLTRLFRADLHAVLDRLEEPDVLLRQSLREMEEIIADEEQRLLALVRSGENLESRIAELSRGRKELAAEMDLCFENDRADLARALIRRRLETERLITALGNEHDAVLAKRKILVTELNKHRDQFEEIRLRAEQAAAGYPKQTADTTSGGIGDDEIEVAFLREQSKRGRS